ncbi:major capsid protein, partial [bacterium]|nr:major capsid protein [bacterium]
LWIGVETAFQTFFTTGQTIFSDSALTVEIDMIRGNRKTAQLIRRGSQSRVLNKKEVADNKSSHIVREYPLMEEIGAIGADKLNFRIPGDTAFVQKTKLDRLRQLAVTQNKESMRRIIRACERLAAQSVLTGVQDAIFDTTNTGLQYDFLRTPANIISVGTEWDNSGDIMGDLNTGCEKVRQNGKVTPDGLLLGQGALDALIKDTTMQALADNRRYELIQINDKMPVPPQFAKFVASGFIPYGRLRTTEGYTLWMFTYQDEYETDAGVVTKYMPTDQALIFSSQARQDRYFGPSEVFPLTRSRVELYREVFGFDISQPLVPPNIKNPGMVVNPAMFWVDAYFSSDYKTVNFRTQAAPIFATVHTDAFCTLTDLLV